MANISAKVIDTDREVVPFAVVFLSDKDGKPTTPYKNATADDKGNFTLKDIPNDGYVTATSTGYLPTTALASSIKDSIALAFNKESKLEEVVVEGNKPGKSSFVYSKLTPTKKNYLTYIIVGVVSLIIIILLAYFLLRKKTKK